MKHGIWLLLVACKGGGGDSDTDASVPLDPATVPLGGPCAMDVDQGGFVVQSGGDGTGVHGNVADGVVPVTVLTEIGEEGGCRLLRQENPRCEPPCAPSDTCGLDGECVPYPRNQDLGVVGISGLVQAVQMEPVFPGNTYFDTSLADPPYTAGELVTLSMPGGVYGPLTLHGVGLSSIASAVSEWVVVSGEDLSIDWTPPTGTVVRSQVAVQIRIDQHGASPASLHCAFEDTGHAVIPGVLLGQLVDVGVTGFPIGKLERRTVDQAALAGGGCMDFAISAPVDVAVDVDGYTPCVSQVDCPYGQTCNTELQICE